MKTTRYFEEHVWRKRPYLRREWRRRIIANPLRCEDQVGGSVRFWGIVPELDGRVLRVVTVEDGETVHNAFLDRNFVPPDEEPREDG